MCRRISRHEEANPKTNTNDAFTLCQVLDQVGQERYDDTKTDHIDHGDEKEGEKSAFSRIALRRHTVTNYP